MPQPASPTSGLPALTVFVPATPKLGERAVHTVAAAGARKGPPNDAAVPTPASTDAVGAMLAERLREAQLLVGHARELLDALSCIGRGDCGHRKLERVRTVSEFMFADARSNWAGEAGIFCVLMTHMDSKHLNAILDGLDAFASDGDGPDQWTLKVIQRGAAELVDSADLRISGKVRASAAR